MKSQQIAQHSNSPITKRRWWLKVEWVVLYMFFFLLYQNRLLLEYKHNLFFSSFITDASKYSWNLIIALFSAFVVGGWHKRINKSYLDIVFAFSKGFRDANIVWAIKKVSLRSSRPPIFPHGTFTSWGSKMPSLLPLLQIKAPTAKVFMTSGECAGSDGSCFACILAATAQVCYLFHICWMDLDFFIPSGSWGHAHLLVFLRIFFADWISMYDPSRQ